jgi:small subunit ribosomal protein S29e
MPAKALINAHPKQVSGSRGARFCRVSGSNRSIIRKYGINMTRQSFRERAADIGFIKYN